MKYTPIAGLSALLIVGLASQLPAQEPAPQQRKVLSQMLQELGSDTAVLIDVREKTEWNDGHLAAARFVPMSTLQDSDRRSEALRQFDRDKTIYCHCMRGARAEYCAQILAKLGYKVLPLKMNYETLVRSGLREIRSRQPASSELIGK